MDFSTLNASKNISHQKMTREKVKDAGMVISFVCLFAGYFFQVQPLILLSLVLLFVNMIIPAIYHYPARALFFISDLLGSVMSKILLTVIYYVFVTPLGFMLRSIAKDPLQLKKWKQDKSTVFKIREHEFQSEDLERPY
ncbi:MAG: hypothetical protein SRB2_00421 [Desulfobacteraceae bacterium Eth-SRB2]|nr:MAG: hypothetical protein SRB2_00421 [Desulfobacteraceae bacterium Eth-SRB2]